MYICVYIYMYVCSVTIHVQLFVTSQTVANEAFLAMEFFRQKYCSGLSLPTQGDLLDPETESASPSSPALARGFFTTEPPELPIYMCISL